MRRTLLASALLMALASACAETPPPSSTAQPALKTDAELIFAQEAGELPAPQGACPERTELGVLDNPRAAVTRTAFGLAYCVLHDAPGGAVPSASDKVKVDYNGWTPEGKLFDSSIERGEPADFSLAQVIRGWTEMLQLMTPGDKVRVWIPGDMAYGNKQPGEEAEQGPPKGTLIFEIELLEVLGQTAPATGSAGAPSM